MTYKATSLHKIPCPGGHEINHFGRTLLGHYYYIFFLSDLCQVIEKISLSLWWETGMKFTIFCLFAL